MRLARRTGTVLALVLALSSLTACVAVEPDQPSQRAQGGGPDVTSLIITVENGTYDQKMLDAPANTQVTLLLRNLDGAVHNVSIYLTPAATTPIFIGELIAGPADREYAFRTPSPGDYFFRCDVRRETMTGTFRVVQ